MHEVFGSPWATRSASHAAKPSSSKEHVENVHGGVETSTTAATLFNSLFAMCIIDTSFIFIAEDLICHWNFFEFFCGIGTRVLVRVKFKGKFSVSFLQIYVWDAGFDAQYVVELRFFDHFADSIWIL